MNDRLLVILNLLHENRGEFISGQEISSQLDISRTAVWKYIKKLRGMDYEIESRSSRGYKLRGIPDRLVPEEVVQGLGDHKFGRNLKVFSSLGSTNDKARELIEKGAGEGTIVVAEEQTRGKGRRGRRWFSPPGAGLWFSIIMEPDFSPGEAPLLTVAALLAVHDILLARGLPAEVKWPNDILLNDKKVCGILSELIVQPDTINYAIIGIGMNVNQTSFPELLGEKATSLRIFSGNRVNRVILLQSILNKFVLYYNRLPEGQKDIISSWKNRLQLIGREIIIESAGNEYQGKAVDISQRGELLLQDESGEIQSFWAGDTSLVKED